VATPVEGCATRTRKVCPRKLVIAASSSVCAHDGGLSGRIALLVDGVAQCVGLLPRSNLCPRSGGFVEDVGEANVERRAQRFVQVADPGSPAMCQACSRLLAAGQTDLGRVEVSRRGEGPASQGECQGQSGDQEASGIIRGRVCGPLGNLVGGFGLRYAQFGKVAWARPPGPEAVPPNFDEEIMEASGDEKNAKIFGTGEHGAEAEVAWTTGAEQLPAVIWAIYARPIDGRKEAITRLGIV